MRELVANIENIEQQLFEFAIEGAADASVRHFVNVVAFNAHYQVVVDWNFAKFVFDYGKLMFRILPDQLVEQGCFAGTQKSGKYGNRQAVVVGVVCHAHFQFVYLCGAGTICREATLAAKINFYCRTLRNCVIV